MAAGGVDPPHGAAHIVEGQTEAFEVVGAEVLPGDGFLRPVPMGGDPAGAGTTERAIAVVDKQRCLLAFHQSNRNASASGSSTVVCTRCAPIDQTIRRESHSLAREGEGS